MIGALFVLAGFCWSLALFRRVKGQSLPDETLGLAIGLLCGLNGVAQAAQGLTGFELPSSPLLVLNALCFGVLVIMPLQLTANTPASYATLAPIEQTRTRSFDTIAIALLVPMFLITIARRDDAEWAVWYFVAVGAVLLMLALIRGKLAVRETRRLYSEVESAAETRRQLLVDVLQSADHDRHRVATQLHQQATGFYVALTSFLRLTADEENPVLRGMRDDLENQAEGLRELMLAVRPLQMDESGSAALKATIAAYIDSIYLDAPSPQVDFRVDQDLALEWATETIVMRILQEALRNVAKHAQAQHIIVSIEEHEEGIAVRVLDDGVGFDAKRLLFESGNEYMRKFASHLDGHVFIESEPGRGTTAMAVLGVQARAAPALNSRPLAEGRRNHLRLVTTPSSGPVPTADRDATDPRPSRHAKAGDDKADREQDAWGRAQANVRGVSARMAQRRAASAGRRFLYFRATLSESVLREGIEVGFAVLVFVPFAIVSLFVLARRPEAQTWMIISISLGSLAVLGASHFVVMFRREKWDGCDPRALLLVLIIGMMADAAYGVATGGEPSLFMLGLIIILLVAVIAGSPTMIALLWGVAVAAVCFVLVMAYAPTPHGVVARGELRRRQRTHRLHGPPHGVEGARRIAVA